MDAVAVLEIEKIDYAVIGAMAASVHGVVRASLDADAVISLTVQQAPALEKKFRAAGFLTTLNRGDLEDPIPAVLSVADSLQNRVDLLVGLRGLESAAFARAVEVPFQGAPLRFIGREDFVAMKVFAGGPQDIVDAKAAISAARTSLDTALLRRLAKQFGRDASELLEELLAG
jgi:predicted nucleotidyltransferase